MIDDGKINAGMVENDDPFSNPEEKIGSQQNVKAEEKTEPKQNENSHIQTISSTDLTSKKPNIKIIPNKPDYTKDDNIKSDKYEVKKPKRKRITRREKLELDLKKELKKNEDSQKKIALLKEQIRIEDMTPEQRKEELRKIETRRAIILGLGVIKVISKNLEFTIENLKNEISPLIDNEADKEYFENLLK